jgi:hypothetical protein
VYFAMAFSFVVEMLNIQARSRRAKAVETIHLAKKLSDDQNA